MSGGVGTLKGVLNMANSMIGVGILAMPFCVQEVKIILPRAANDLNLKNSVA